MALSPGKRYPGANERIDILFSDDFGTLTDPTAVVFKTRSPCGGGATYTYGTDVALQRVATGEYLCDFTLTEAGRWFYRWEATGLSLPFVQEGNFIVQVSTWYDDSCNTGYTL